MSRRKYLIIILVVVIIFSLFFLYKKSEVKVINVSEKILNLKIEEVRTQAEQNLGLSGRESLGKDEGMLFIFSPPELTGFWMKDMNFALDIIWLDENYKVLGIEKSVGPETYPKIFMAPAPVSYVLEVNAGYTTRQNISVGDVLKFH